MQKTLTVGVRVDAFATVNEAVELAFAAYEKKHPWLMTFVNPATVVLAHHQPMLREALEKFDAVAPDGSGMVLAMRLSHPRVPVTRISFDSTSLAPAILETAARREIAIVLIGGKPGTAKRAAECLTHAYRGLRIVGIFDGYCDHNATVNAIAQLSPGIVIAGMGGLVQELFLIHLVERGWHGLGFTCGGYLDQTALKGETYYPEWINRHNLRFAYRFVMEPKRLGRRYLMEYPVFGWYLGNSLVVELARTVSTWTP